MTDIDPQVDLQTRTTKVRVEVPNPEHRLRLGMYMTMVFAARSGERRVVVPRVIELGPLVGDVYTVRRGLSPGELVVTAGSFFLRAEMLRNSPV